MHAGIDWFRVTSEQRPNVARLHRVFFVTFHYRASNCGGSLANEGRVFLNTRLRTERGRFDSDSFGGRSLLVPVGLVRPIVLQHFRHTGIGRVQQKPLAFRSTS